MRSAARVALWAMTVLPAIGACKRSKPPFATQLWLGPHDGCIEGQNKGQNKDRSDGAYVCWGANEAGELGDGTRDARPYATALKFKEGSVTSLVLGDRHSCGVFNHRNVACWGDGSQGQLGIDGGVRLTPVAVEFPSTSEPMIAVGSRHTCVASGHRVRCFGANDEGQLGKTPELDGTDAGEIRSIATGDAHTCVAYLRTPTSPAFVACRGRKVAAPSDKLLVGTGVRALAAGGDHTCALLEDTTVVCWGRDDAGQLGDGTTNDSGNPVMVLGLRGAADITLGTRHSCARLANKSVSCWGDNAHHQLANGTTERSSRAVPVYGLLGVEEIAAAGDSSCVRLDDGFVRCWGANERGQLGEGTKVEHDVPMPPKFR